MSATSSLSQHSAPAIPATDTTHDSSPRSTPSRLSFETRLGKFNAAIPPLDELAVESYVPYQPHESKSFLQSALNPERHASSWSDVTREQEEIVITYKAHSASQKKTQYPELQVQLALKPDADANADDSQQCLFKACTVRKINPNMPIVAMASATSHDTPPRRIERRPSHLTFPPIFSPGGVPSVAYPMKIDMAAKDMTSPPQDPVLDAFQPYAVPPVIAPAGQPIYIDTDIDMGTEDMALPPQDPALGAFQSALHVCVQRHAGPGLNDTPFAITGYKHDQDHFHVTLQIEGGTAPVSVTLAKATYPELVLQWPQYSLCSRPQLKPKVADYLKDHPDATAEMIFQKFNPAPVMPTDATEAAMKEFRKKNNFYKGNNGAMKRFDQYLTDTPEQCFAHLLVDEQGMPRTNALAAFARHREAFLPGNALPSMNTKARLKSLLRTSCFDLPIQKAYRAAVPDASAKSNTAAVDFNEFLEKQEPPIDCSVILAKGQHSLFFKMQNAMEAMHPLHSHATSVLRALRRAYHPYGLDDFIDTCLANKTGDTYLSSRSDDTLRNLQHAQQDISAYLLQNGVPYDRFVQSMKENTPGNTLINNLKEHLSWNSSVPGVMTYLTAKYKNAAPHAGTSSGSQSGG